VVERIFCDACERPVGEGEIPDWFAVAIIPMSADSKKVLADRAEADLCPRCYAGLRVQEAHQVVLQVTRKGAGNVG
jgi:hypothetical protein